ncbi:hypothetical protein SLA2020_443080 [Shorea laevis]
MNIRTCRQLDIEAMATICRKASRGRNAFAAVIAIELTDHCGRPLCRPTSGANSRGPYTTFCDLHNCQLTYLTYRNVCGGTHISNPQVFQGTTVLQAHMLE